MPMFVNVNGILITVFALLHWSFALTKLSVAPSLGTYPPTTEPFFNATMTTKTNSGITKTEDESYRDGRYLQNTNDVYRWHGITQPQQQHPQTSQSDYTYSDYPNTSPGELSTMTYPFITTQKPVLRHLKFRPRVTKLQVKSVRRGQGINNMFADSESFEEPDSDFVPLVTLYGSQINRWSTMPTHHVSQYTYGGTQPAKGFTGFSSSSTGAATSLAHSGLTFTGGSSSALEDLHQSAAHHHVPIITQIHPHQIHHTPKFDMKKIGILALVKIGLAKLKAFGILKLIFILLLKLKLFLLAMFIKFVLFMKLLKVLKSLLIPLILLAIFIPLLLALLLLPLLLAPLLYPLISMLPIIPAINIRPKSRIHMLKDQENDTNDTLSNVMDQLLSSTQCIEKIACELATKKEAKLFFPYVNWYLNKISYYLQNEKVSTYVDVYTKTVKEYKGKYSEEDGEQWCAAKYHCEKSDASKELKESHNSKKMSKFLEPLRNHTA